MQVRVDDDIDLIGPDARAGEVFEQLAARLDVHCARCACRLRADARIEENRLFGGPYDEGVVPNGDAVLVVEVGCVAFPHHPGHQPERRARVLPDDAVADDA